MKIFLSCIVWFNRWLKSAIISFYLFCPSFYMLFCVFVVIICLYVGTKNIKFGLIWPGGPKDSKLCSGLIQIELKGQILNKWCKNRPIWYIYIQGSKIYESLWKVSLLIWPKRPVKNSIKKILANPQNGPI